MSAGGHSVGSGITSQSNEPHVNFGPPLNVVHEFGDPVYILLCDSHVVDCLYNESKHLTPLCTVTLANALSMK
jgi:hypothetical protein